MAQGLELCAPKGHRALASRTVRQHRVRPSPHRWENAHRPGAEARWNNGSAPASSCHRQRQVSWTDCLWRDRRLAV